MKLGWFKESKRHSLASQGIKTGRKTQQQSNASLIASLRKKKPFKDFDGDGVVNRFDCNPVDASKQGQQHTLGRVATKISKENDRTVIRYHNTDVVAFNNDEIVLDSGGWSTATTKTRMNQASNQFNLGYNVFQKDYTWFVDYKSKTIPFHDGMSLNREQEKKEEHKTEYVV